MNRLLQVGIIHGRFRSARYIWMIAIAQELSRLATARNIADAFCDSTEQGCRVLRQLRIQLTRFATVQTTVVAFRDCKEHSCCVSRPLRIKMSRFATAQNTAATVQHRIQLRQSRIELWRFATEKKRAVAFCDSPE